MCTHSSSSLFHPVPIFTLESLWCKIKQTGTKAKPKPKAQTSHPRRPCFQGTGPCHQGAPSTGRPGSWKQARPYHLHLEPFCMLKPLDPGTPSAQVRPSSHRGHTHSPEARGSSPQRTQDPATKGQDAALQCTALSAEAAPVFTESARG